MAHSTLPLKYADIILPLSIPRPLTYGVPVQWQGQLLPGMRVEVAMGRSKLYAGVVWQIHDQKPEQYKTKPIRALIDDEPILTHWQMQLWQWIASYYMCSLGDVMQAALPAHLKLMGQSILIWNDNYTQVPQSLSDDAYLIAEALQLRKKLSLEETRELLSGGSIAAAMDELLSRELAIISDELEEKFKPKTENYVALHPSFQDDNALSALFEQLKNAPKQMTVLLAYLQLSRKYSQVATIPLLDSAKATAGHLKALIDKGILEKSTLAVSRLPYTGTTSLKKNVLTEEQAAALLHIQQQWQDRNTVLLQGVTGSGKTMLYIALIEEAIARDQQVLLLLPEIALTTQIVARLTAYFGEALGVYHSKYSNNERVEIWRKTENKEYKVIVGARSSIWLPYMQLAYVIVDEEHDSSYKQQDPAPRFNARDVGIYLAGLHGAKVLLGSATPSVESFYNHQVGKYGYAQLLQRYQGYAMPQVSIVSGRAYIPALSNILTSPLLDTINQNLQQGRQIILFQNKRGYAPFLICGNCGHVPHCQYCDVSLTYHKFTDKMHCHYCGTRTAVPQLCPACGQNKMGNRSFGTEKIVEELQRVFSKITIGRLDLDAVRGKNAHSRIMTDFGNGRIQILVGTQMVVKGLDFDNVGLVGVLSADSLLAYPDFRVHEKAFQILEQVAGRAGRSHQPGTVIIQAFKTKHPILRHVVAHDYQAFYDEELQYREQFRYPPYARFIKITVKNKQEPVAQKGIDILAAKLLYIPNILIKGPSAALVARLRNQYQFELWITMPTQYAAIVAIKEAISRAIMATRQTRGYSQLSVLVDVDPL